MTDTAVQTETLSLSVPQVAAVKGEVVPVAPAQESAAEGLDPKFVQKADAFVSRVLRDDVGEMKQALRSSVDQMGLGVQRQAAHTNALLQQQIQSLSANGADGGPVANALVDLKLKVDDLNPNHMDFSVSSFAKAFSWIPGVGKPIERYFMKYETSQGVLDQITKSLEAGRGTLERDNVTLSGEQQRMREITIQLTQQVKLGQVIDQKLEAAAAGATDAERADFIREELLFPLKQRVIDLQQQLAVSQQAVLAMEVLIRNNRELIRGVDRALNVTVSALAVAVTVALALNNQRLVLERVTLLNQTTSDLIAGTARQLRTQGVEIQKQASSSMLEMEKLRAAFNDIDQALGEISRFRQEALPQMASQILELDTMAKEATSAIEKMEEGRAIQDEDLKLDIA